MGERSLRRRVLLGAGVAAAVAAVAGGTGLAVLKYQIDHYRDPGRQRIAAAGYRQRVARVGEVAFSYAEGPDNGPPLVLLHAQHMDWYSYHLVLPALAESFHVFDVDYPGHGGTVCPAGYPMTAERIGADLAGFLESVVGQPAHVSGNSSGGLLAIWLAANRPRLVRSVVLEDPPLFSAEYPRIARTIADRSFRTCANAVREGTGDFLLYWIRASKPFFDKNVGPGAARLLIEAIKEFRRARPGEPVEIGLLPNDTVRQFLRGLDQFDPRFGAAFHDGSWHAGFDHASALGRVGCPALLIQANFSVLADGTLDGAMTGDDAARALALLRRGTYRRIDATHVVHLDKPQDFVRMVTGFVVTGNQ
ncbi:alpha/beta fold hydrolase [Actinoplanes sp. L3-i22]|uniref:alpha/beta fold hydrolase n=1 Tax=Actinoplanes sp. L3-i22 TaxID=2836373 RepID=UPI001C85A680|nr:alpha/beta hydrolase [Actinoplanes sp. L3-i22]